MLRSAPLLVCLLASGCYLRHTLGEAEDGAVDGASRPDGACCVALGCAGGALCEAGEECGPGGCVPACEGPRCGGACCAAEELCRGDRCVAIGPTCASDAACAPGDRCDPIAGRCAPATRASCMEARPFEPIVRWEDTSVMATTVPLVVPLDGDAIPDLVVVTVPRTYEDEALPPDRNSMIAYSGRDGRRLWELDMFTSPCSHSPPAAGDVDGDGRVEVVALVRLLERHAHVSTNPEDPLPCSPCMEECGPFRVDRGRPHGHRRCADPRIEHVHSGCADYRDAPGAVAIIAHDGEVERIIPIPLLPRPNEMDAIEIVDLDADGSAEIVAHGIVIDASGIRWSDERLSGVGTAIGDLDGDGLQEIVTAQHAFEHDGTLRWSVEADVHGHPVIGDVLRDPVSRGPTVIVADGRTLVVRDGASGAPLLGPFGYAVGRTSGPPNLADFDGDGRPEIGVPADHGYLVIDPDLPEPPYTRWTVPTADRTPGTVGASAFDFDADGAVDVAYTDECHLRLISGRDGTVLHTRSNASLTIWEYPVVADVDADGEAELVVTSNIRRLTQLAHNGCATRPGGWDGTPGAVRVLEDRLHNWGGTHGIWNQHAYHVDNVLADGRIPVEAPRPWATHGSWRANPRFPDPRDVHLPSLRVTALAVEGAGCALDAVVRARVENHGSRGSEPGAAIVLSAAGRALATAHTTRALVPGAAEWVELPAVRSAALESPVRAEVDPASPCAAGEPIAILEPACAP